jgi:hypothetical protein
VANNLALPTAVENGDSVVWRAEIALAAGLLAAWLEVVSQSASGCGRPRSPRATLRVLRGIYRFRCDLASCPSLLGLARRPYVKPIPGKEQSFGSHLAWSWGGRYGSVHGKLEKEVFVKSAIEFVDTYVLAAVLLVAAGIGGSLLASTEDDCPCEWMGTWTGSGWASITCAGVCAEGCYTWQSPASGNWHCFCDEGPIVNLCNCYGVRSKPANGVEIVICVQADACSLSQPSSPKKCITPDESKGWNGNVGSAYILCACQTPK